MCLLVLEHSCIQAVWYRSRRVRTQEQISRCTIGQCSLDVFWARRECWFGCTPRICPRGFEAESSRSISSTTRVSSCIIIYWWVKARWCQDPSQGFRVARHSTCRNENYCCPSWGRNLWQSSPLEKVVSLSPKTENRPQNPKSNAKSG